MQGYQVLEESILYDAGQHECELMFFRCNESHKRYPIYDLDLMVDGVAYLDLFELTAGVAENNFTFAQLRKIIVATTEALDDWCNRHPNTFISLFDCLSNLWRVYYRLGFASDDRIETFVAFLKHTQQ